MSSRTFATVFLIASACGPQTTGGIRAGADDDELPPLSSRDAVFHNAPKNDSIKRIGKADAVYPAQSTELLSFQSPIRNQGSRGTCTIFSSIGLMEHLYITAGVSDPDFSEQYLQWAVKVQHGSNPDTGGSDNPANLATIQQFGIVEEQFDPYNTNEWGPGDDPQCTPDGTETQRLPTKCWTQGDPPAAAQSAPKYTLPQGQWLNTASIKEHITTQKTAVVVAIEFFYQAWNHGLSKLPVGSMKEGVVRYPNNEDITDSRNEPAGHGILIVGWDDNKQIQAVDKNGNPAVDANGLPIMQKGFYIFKNSWGTTVFGSNNPNGAGYGYIQYQYINDFASAYVDGLPTVCDYRCQDYGYAPGQCYQGWSCDAAGQCMTQTGACN